MESNEVCEETETTWGYCKRSIDMIEKHLFLSDYGVAENLSLLQTLDIKYVLSVFDDDLNQKSETITYMKIEVADNYYQDLLTRFPETNQFIRNAQDSGENVLVHCHAGISRSATLVIAFIMNKYKMPYKSARALVRRHRGVHPNESFVEQLKLYEEMGFTLNANNRKLRQHLIICVLNVESLLTTKHINKIEEYFKRRDLAEDMTKNHESGVSLLNLGPKCLCVQCGHHLFNEIHIFRSDVSPSKTSDPKKVCDSTYIEPQKWMTQITQPFEHKPENVIKCPKCGEKVIEYKRQLIQYWCECCIHSEIYGKCLRFRIANEKFKIEEKD